MELLILAGLSLIGYEMSRKDSLKSINPPVIKQPILTSKLNNGVKIDQNTPLPFFRSEKSQNTNDGVKDVRLATFTGIDNLEYTNKKESTPMFQPTTDLTNINGGKNTLDSEMTYYTTSTVHNNTLPFQQQKVGRGLGTDPSVSASGGFHEQFRILPDNVNGYRKNVHEGRVVRGVAPVTNRTANSNVAQNKNVVKCATRDVFPAKSQYDFQTSRSDNSVSLNLTNRGQQSCNAGFIGNNRTGMELINASTREYDSTKCFNPGNPSMEHNGAGYANNTYLVDKNDYSNCTPAINAHNSSKSGYVFDVNTDIKQTMRGDENCKDGFISGGEQKGLPIYNYEALPTMKQLDSCYSYQGGAHGSVRQTEPRHHNISNTQRGNCNTGFGGPAGSFLPSSAQYQQTYQQDPHTSREMVTTGYTPGAGRMNITLDGHEVIDQVNMDKQDTNNTNYVPVSTLPGQSNYTNLSTMGVVNIPQKLPETNRRLQLSIAKDQLQSNNLHININ